MGNDQAVSGLLLGKVVKAMTAHPAGVHNRPTLWYGWVVLAVVFLVMAVLVGVRNSLGFFFKAVAGEFGWTRAQTAGAYSVGMIVQSVCSPLFGSLGERWSLRWMMALGVFFGGAALLIGSSIGGLVQFYLMYALLNVGFAASTFVPQVQILSNWFVKRRGLAIGIANSGQGFAAVLNLAVPFLIALIGWRRSYLVLALFTVAVIFPLAAFLLRDHPHDRATVADAPFISAGEQDARAEEERRIHRNGTAAAAGVPFLTRVCSLPFLLIVFTYCAVAFIFIGTTVHIIPHATDQGFTPEASGLVFLVWGICIIGGNLTSALSDSLGRAPTYAVGTALGVCACVLLAWFKQGMPPALFIVGAALSGAALGLTRPTASALLADHFAGPGFGRLNGSVMMLFALFGALGAFTTGLLYDISGSYRDAFLALAVAHAAGAASAIPLARMRPTVSSA
ncbi:MAG: MFS transporter [Syntrophales bacterium]